MYIIIMYDNHKEEQPRPLGMQIRSLRAQRGWTLAALAERAGTSAPTVHRYENGWDRFELGTLRRLAAALGAHLQVQLLDAAPRNGVGEKASLTTHALVQSLQPLFWDRKLAPIDLQSFPRWVIERVLMFGDLHQVRAVRAHFTDALVREAALGRGTDTRTRNYWQTVLGE